jgi:hypothetical protein
MISQTAPDGTRTILTIVEWPHRGDGSAHCLARLVLPPAGKPVAVLSEVRRNDEANDLLDDFPAAADALLAQVAGLVALPVTEVVWIAHYGPFSYYENAGPETYSVVPLHWDGAHYRAAGEDRRLTPAEVADTLGRVPLEPVPDAVVRLGRTF